MRAIPVARPGEYAWLQGAGKTTFYRQRFADTHLRISMDMLRTRHREAGLYQACLDYKQPVVVDNTNPFDALYHVVTDGSGGFRVEEWHP